MASEIRRRFDGYLLSSLANPGIVRFPVRDINTVIKTASAASALYKAVQREFGVPPDYDVIPLSCFAVALGWTPGRLAALTRFHAYYEVAANDLLDAGYPLWPTATFENGVPDPRNEVHFDLIAACGPRLIPTTLGTGSPAERALARNELRPHVESVLALFPAPVELPRLTEPPTTGDLGERPHRDLR